MRDYHVDIGIECHVQLKTESKLFCGCSNYAREAEPNTLVCPVCMGLPGTLPVLNKRAVELAIQASYALNSEIAEQTKFDRKNYFYPDLPKGYQITQFDEPIIGKGEVEVPLEDKTFTVRITRAHLEEDAGKLIHPEGADYSLVDLNRAGTPLLEIVSEPDIHSAQEAKAYAQELYNRMRYGGISDADLYYGNMRFDVNISVRPDATAPLGTRAEIKNLNSFRNVEKATEFEIARQVKLLEAGEKVIQETRGWDEQKTFSQRSKEEAHDYRYFPEPDLPPLVITKKMKEQAQEALPKLVQDIRRELMEAGIGQEAITALLNYPVLVNKLLAERDEAKATPEDLQRIANWLTNAIIAEISDKPELNKDDIFKEPGHLTKLSRMVAANQVSSSGAKAILSRYADFSDPEVIAQELGVIQVSDSGELEQMVRQAIADSPQAADDVRNGEMKAIGFLVGQVMKLSRGQANPQMVQELIKKELS